MIQNYETYESEDIILILFLYFHIFWFALSQNTQRHTVVAVLFC